MVNPTTAMHDAPMSGLANLMAMKGRENDSMLVHLSPSEVSNLNKLSGNTMTINPHTGLPEGRSRILESVLPALLSIGAGIATGGMSTAAQIAAAAAAGYGGQRLVGRGHDEALTSGLISAATAGLLGGVGSDALAGGTAKGVAAREAAKAAGKEAVPTILKDSLIRETVRKGGETEAARILAEQATKDLAKRKLAEVSGSVISPFFAAPRDVFGEITAQRLAPEGAKSLTQILGQPEIYKPLATQFAGQAGLNALTDQMRADANRPRDLSRPPTAVGELWSQPYNFALQGPYSQQDITGAFMGNNITPLNFYNQGFAKEGGSVQHMAQGGLAGLPVHMGIGGDIAKILTAPLKGLRGIFGGRKRSGVAHPTGQPTGQPLQLGNTFGGEPISPPLPADIFEQAQEEDVQLAFGGALGKYIPSVAIINSLMDKLGSDKKSVSPTTTHNYYGVGPDGKPILMDGSPQQIAYGQPMSQQMAGGGAIGKVRDWSEDLKNKFYGSQLMEPLMRIMGKDPSKYMAGGGLAGLNIPPELLEKLKAMAGQASAPAPKAYDQLAALGPNPMQQMQGGGLTGAAEAAGSMMPALQPLIEVASEEALNAVAQPRTYAQTQPVQPFQAGGQPFEGRVAGQGDGMSDQIPFNIEGQQPALLSRDEYVVPADVVAMVGDGSSNAGADQFDNFIGNIRKMKYGRQVQPRELNQGLGSLLGVA